MWQRRLRWLRRGSLCRHRDRGRTARCAMMIAGRTRQRRPSERSGTRRLRLTHTSHVVAAAVATAAVTAATAATTTTTTDAAATTAAADAGWLRRR